jgi:hypothetical protein
LGSDLGIEIATADSCSRLGRGTKPNIRAKKVSGVSQTVGYRIDLLVRIRSSVVTPKDFLKISE